jgi:sulfite exporter TauE/SafE
MITQQMTLLAALVAGFFSSAHCFGMCGGIAAALGSGNPSARHSPVRGLGDQLLFNGGRILSYAIAGTIAGGASFLLGSLIDIPAWTAILRIATGLVMVAIGLQLAINWRGLRHIETLGGKLWRRLSPLLGRLLPVRSPGAALGVGMLWGWLPCGLVYTMLLAAAVSGSAATGGALMLAFGAGTLPAMVGLGLSAGGLNRLLGQRAMRRTAGALLLAFGAWTIAIPILHLGHDHGAHAEHPAAPADHH